MIKDEKVLEQLKQYKVKCQCSHVIIMTPKTDRAICSHCGIGYIEHHK